MFGREFPMIDVLVLWDALFADGPMLNLVDYIYISMLEAIRDRRTYLLPSTIFIPVPRYQFLYENGEFFSPFSKKFSSTRCVFLIVFSRPR